MKKNFEKRKEKHPDEKYEKSEKENGKTGDVMRNSTRKMKRINVHEATTFERIPGVLGS